MIVSQPSSSRWFVEHPDKSCLVAVDCVEEGGVLLAKAEQESLERVGIGLHQAPDPLELWLASEEG